ncbi:MAG: DUF1801 domain-containing protein [Gemmatimonadales bacterium]
MPRELKTKETKASVAKFLDAIPEAGIRADCKKVAALMKKATGAPGKMWGPGIVGFGDRVYQGASGSTNWMIVGFAPRKANLTLYLVGAIQRHPALLKRLGKHKTGKGCLYVKRLADVDVGVLGEIIEASVALAPAAK